jgi:hypothetical protein
LLFYALQELIGDDDGITEQQQEAALEQVDLAWVKSERSARIGGGDQKVTARTDLWIEIPRHEPHQLIVIENKVEDEAREGQLGMYESAISLRLDQPANHGVQGRVRALLLEERLRDPAWPEVVAAASRWIPGTTLLSRLSIAGGSRDGEAVDLAKRTGEFLVDRWRVVLETLET